MKIATYGQRPVISSASRPSPAASTVNPKLCRSPVAAIRLTSSSSTTSTPGSQPRSVPLRSALRPGSSSTAITLTSIDRTALTHDPQSEQEPNPATLTFWVRNADTQSRGTHVKRLPSSRSPERLQMPDPEVAVAEQVDARVLLDVLAQLQAGDFSARMPLDWTGVAGKVADGFNEVIIANQTLGDELGRVSRVVGKQGELSQRLALGGSTRIWSGSVESVNSLIDALVRPTSEMQRVIGAVADGDLSKKVSVDVNGEMLVLKNTINAMVDQLNGFASEVTRVAREVGTEGKLGQAAAVTIEVGDVWKDLTDNVKLMAGNLTGQVRNIAEVTTAVANGDLSKKISIDVKGEFLELKNTVNAMVDQLNAFASEVTRVAREVGGEGKLGGQAQSQEVAGVWKNLTDDVNQLAANLTNQVRAISEVATAVTEGDLTRQVGV